MHNPTTKDKITPFSFINTILNGTDLDLNEVTVNAYNAFIINKGLSFHKDCIFIVNEMNMRPNIDSRMHFDFYKYSVRKYKRPYMKWINKEQSEKVELIKKYFDYSTEKAVEIIDLISDENLNDIRIKLSKGGISK